MEKKALQTRFILPPNVNGRCRGRLSLCLHEIQWQNDEPFQFNWIQAKLIWWGDKYHSSAAIKYVDRINQLHCFIVHFFFKFNRFHLLFSG